MNALRFIAALSVFFFHLINQLKAAYPSLTEITLLKPLFVIFDKGNLGVNFFFVLSGFLITYLILEEIKNFGSFSLSKFLIRRTLRIWPLYFIIILLGFVIFPLLFSDYYTDHKLINYLLFLANFDEIWHGINDPINFLTVPWSVAVEEQFYLFWGVLIWALLRLKKIKMGFVIFVLYILCFIFRTYHWQDEYILYYHTIAVAQDILTGAFVGLSVFKGREWIEKLKNLKQWQVIFIYAVGLFICIAKNKIFADQMVIFERFILSIFFAYVIIDQSLGKNSFYKFGKIKYFNYFGKISYGVYMYHLLIMYLTAIYLPDFENKPGLYLIVHFGVNLSLTLIISSLSYRFIESKFLALKPSQKK